MTERLRPRDLALLATESPSTPMHNATVEIFEPGESGFDYSRLVELIADRIAFVPALPPAPADGAGPARQPRVGRRPGLRDRLPRTPLRAAAPRRPPPAARAGRPDRVAPARPQSRPLWEIYFVEGLEGGRVAVLTKSHQILVDGRETVDIGQVLLDTDRRRPELGHDEWQPRGRPTALSLALGAVTDIARAARDALHTVRANAESVARTANVGRPQGR